jgi:hypothetical protein
MASVDLDKLGIPFMASALEEHLITSLRNDVNLINGTGNKSSRAKPKQVVIGEPGRAFDSPTQSPSP